MPFGIQTKGLVIGVIIGAVVAPRVIAAVSARKG